jgi:hypothetical protein
MLKREKGRGKQLEQYKSEYQGAQRRAARSELPEQNGCRRMRMERIRDEKGAKVRNEAKVSKIFQAFLDLRISWRQKLIEGHVACIRGNGLGLSEQLLVLTLRA